MWYDEILSPGRDAENRSRRIADIILKRVVLGNPLEKRGNALLGGIRL
jgi:hypothetical protein